MRILKYQGAVLTGGAVGEVVACAGLDWRVTAQGHLVCDVPPEAEAAAQALVDAGFAAPQEA